MLRSCRLAARLAPRLRWAARPLATGAASEGGQHQPPTPPPPTPPPPPPTLDLTSTSAAFAHASARDLLRAWAVLTACRIRPLVAHADGLLRAGRRLLGDRAVDALLRSTFFAHFCGGEDEAGAARTMDRLAGAGVGSILDYAAESDLADGGEEEEENEAGQQQAPSPPAPPPPGTAEAAPPARAVARVFPYYGSETACDAHAATFRAAIAAAAHGRAQPGALPGFAALKVTALGDPRLLARTSASLRALHALFATFDSDGDGRIDRAEFSATYARLFSDGTPSRLDELFAYLDPGGSGAIDLLSWTRRVRLGDVPAIVRLCRAPGPLAASALTPAEYDGLDAMLGRLRGLATAAATAGVRLFVDAEQAAVQPAIAHAARALQREFNSQQPGTPGYPVIFTTVQAYLRSARADLGLDLRRAGAEGWAWAGKIVRGAYLEHERAAAAAAGVPCPVWDTRAETDASYDACAGDAIDAALAGSGTPGVPGPEVMLATHNARSVGAAVGRVRSAGRAPEPCTSSSCPSSPSAPPPVYFGQLLGMGDALTFNLAAAGWGAFKYVPFGSVKRTSAYLVRRAVENAGALGGAASDVACVERELARRAAAALFVPSRVAQRTGGAWK